jgi:glutamate carboxypeptidase
VVPERARIEVDLRAVTVADFERARAEVEAIAARSFVPGTVSTCRASHTHTPMERTPANAALVTVADEVARGLGFGVGEQATGGCGDANISTAAGTATVDGLGPVGGDAHTSTEWLDLASVVPRTALLAGLLARLGGLG